MKLSTRRSYAYRAVEQESAKSMAPGLQPKIDAEWRRNWQEDTAAPGTSASRCRRYDRLEAHK
jgi:hypothetical protein